MENADAGMRMTGGGSGVVAITGANGFVGWHLAEHLRDGGWRVRGIVRPGSPRGLPEGVERVESPLAPDPLARALAGADVLVHNAGLARAASDAAFEAANVMGTRAAVAAANACSARLVLVSSQAAAGTGTIGRPRKEEDAAAPLTPYGRSKLAAEAVLRSSARVPWTIVRPVSVYGPRDRQFLPVFRMAARGLFPLAARPDARFSLIHVSDLVRAMALVLEAEPRGETLFLAHPEPVAARDLLKAVALALNRTFRPMPVPASVLRLLAQAGDVSWRFARPPLFDSSRYLELYAEGFVCSVERAAERLGFRAAVGLTEGVRTTAAWYREQGWL